MGGGGGGATALGGPLDGPGVVCDRAEDGTDAANGLSSSAAVGSRLGCTTSERGGGAGGAMRSLRRSGGGFGTVSSLLMMHGCPDAGGRAGGDAAGGWAWAWLCVGTVGGWGGWAAGAVGEWADVEAAGTRADGGPEPVLNLALSASNFRFHLLKGKKEGKRQKRGGGRRLLASETPKRIK